MRDGDFAQAAHVAASAAERETQTELAVEAARDETPEKAARSVRRAWRLSPGPLPHLLRQVEMHGVVVAVARFGSSERIDAFSCWPVRLDRPVICLTRDRGNVLRRRFSAAHELGHLILHRHPAPGSVRHEREADRFAAEFLMPAADIRPILPHRLDLAQLVELQQQWGVSVQALLHRCNDLETISQTIYKRGMAAITQIGWRRNEPTLEYGGEWPAMLAEALKLAESRGLTEQILADGLCLPPTEVRELFGFADEDRPRLQLISSERSLPTM
jgi:Zn-dependent peptidase ImmA (M78 family)